MLLGGEFAAPRDGHRRLRPNWLGGGKLHVLRSALRLLAQIVVRGVAIAGALMFACDFKGRGQSISAPILPNCLLLNRKIFTGHDSSSFPIQIGFSVFVLVL